MHLTFNRLFGNIRRSYRHLRITSACVAVSLLGGCLQSELVTQGIAYNQALADTHNKLILLNAVRAAYRYPMYFSDTGQLVTRAQDEVSLGLDYNFGADAPNSHTLKPAVKFSGGANTINFNNLNRMEFTNKVFFEENKVETLDFYLSNGWNPDLIYMLFISSFTANLDNLRFMQDIVHVYCRYPGIDIYKEARCKALREAGKQRFVDRFPVRQNKIQIVNNASTFEDFLYVVNMFVIMDGDLKEVAESKPRRKNIKVERGKYSYDVVTKTNKEIIFNNTIIRRMIGRRKVGKELEIDIRSSEAIIYYVGELVRRNLTVRPPALIPVGGPKRDENGDYYLDEAPLVLVKRGSGTNPAIKVSLGRHVFHVPEPDIGDPAAHRSLQVISLINQLLNLATSEKSIPKPSTIVVTN